MFFDDSKYIYLQIMYHQYIFHVSNSDRFTWIWDASLFPNLSEVQSVTDDKKATAKSS